MARGPLQGVIIIIIIIIIISMTTLSIRDINFMLGTELGPYWLICWGFLCPVLLPLLLIYVLVTQVLIIIVIITIMVIPTIIIIMTIMVILTIMVIRIFALSSTFGPQPLKENKGAC